MQKVMKWYICSNDEEKSNYLHINHEYSSLFAL